MKNVYVENSIYQLEVVNYVFDIKDFIAPHIENLCEDCKNRFSPEVIARQLTDIFEKVVEEHKQK